MTIFQKNKAWGLISLLSSLFLILTLQMANGQKANNQLKKWVGTWSTAPYAAGTHLPPEPFLANNTLRQIVRVSIGGETLRLKFTNITSSTAVTMNEVNIAVSVDGINHNIDVSTLKQLKFNGSSSITMAPRSAVLSDPIDFSLKPNTRLAITIYYGDCKTAPDMTFHYGSRARSYIAPGNQAALPILNNVTPVERWYNINSVEVLTDNKSGAVVALGNSITDGYGLFGGLQNRWTDVFSQRLLNQPETEHVSVLNMGIGGTNVTTSGATRFEQDVLNQPGLRWLIIFYGVNDIGGNTTSEAIINAYKKMIKDAHAKNIRVYGATITPFGGSNYFSEAHEKTRGEVNSWIRTQGNFDVCLDFDKVIRDPNDTTRLLPEYSNDWLHPNAEGLRKLGESIDLNLFTGGDTIFPKIVKSNIESHWFEAERFVTTNTGSNFIVIDDALASNGKYITAKPGLHAKNGAPINNSDFITIQFNVTKSGTYNVFARMNNPSFEHDSFWVKTDNSPFINCNGLNTAGNYKWLKLIGIELTQGQHSLTIGYREDGACLDKICITNDDDEPVGFGYDDESISLSVTKKKRNCFLFKCKRSKN